MRRLCLRMFIDRLAIFFAFSVQMAASWNVFEAIISAAAVGAYGLWCFYDGKTSKD